MQYIGLAQISSTLNKEKDIAGKVNTIIRKIVAVVQYAIVISFMPNFDLLH